MTGTVGSRRAKLTADACLSRLSPPVLRLHAIVRLHAEVPASRCLLLADVVRAVPRNAQAMPALTIGAPNHPRSHPRHRAPHTIRLECEPGLSVQLVSKGALDQSAAIAATGRSLLWGGTLMEELL
jgi:hypothetical protein